MPLLILICDNETVVNQLNDTLFAAANNQLLQPQRNVPEPRRSRVLAEGVCTVLNIQPEASTLVSLLGDKPGINNLSAVTNWCEARLAEFELTNQAELVDVLASDLYAHLISKMH